MEISASLFARPVGKGHDARYTAPLDEAKSLKYDMSNAKSGTHRAIASNAARVSSTNGALIAKCI